MRGVWGAGLTLRPLQTGGISGVKFKPLFRAGIGDKYLAVFEPGFGFLRRPGNGLDNRFLALRSGKQALELGTVKAILGHQFVYQGLGIRIVRITGTEARQRPGQQQAGNCQYFIHFHQVSLSPLGPPDWREVSFTH